MDIRTAFRVLTFVFYDCPSPPPPLGISAKGLEYYIVAMKPAADLAADLAGKEARDNRKANHQMTRLRLPEAGEVLIENLKEEKVQRVFLQAPHIANRKSQIANPQ
jgi:hypothetical protein